MPSIWRVSQVINYFMKEDLSYRNQSINLLCKSIDWFLYDRDVRHERVNSTFTVFAPNEYLQKQKKIWGFTDLGTSVMKELTSSSLCLFQMNINSNQKIFGGLNDTTCELLGKNKLDATLLHPPPK